MFVHQNGNIWSRYASIILKQFEFCPCICIHFLDFFWAFRAPLSSPPFLDTCKQNSLERPGSVHPTLSAAGPAKLHTFGVKVPHFALTSRTHFPYISYKFTHFRFSCSPYISLKLRQLQLRFTHVTYSNLAAMRRSALCSSR